MKLELQIESKIDKRLIEQAVLEYGKTIVKETENKILEESKKYLEETDRAHMDAGSLYTSFEVEEPVIDGKSVIGIVKNVSNHASAQEFGRRRPYPLTITEELQQKYTWAKKFNVGDLVWTYTKQPNIPPGVDELGIPRIRGAHPFMAVGLIRAYKWLRTTYKCQPK